METKIPKPLSVRVYGWLAMLLLLFGLLYAGVESSGGECYTAPDWVGMVGLAGVLFGALWFVGTMVHRSRINRMRYR